MVKLLAEACQKNTSSAKRDKLKESINAFLNSRISEFKSGSVPSIPFHVEIEDPFLKEHLSYLQISSDGSDLLVNDFLVSLFWFLFQDPKRMSSKYLFFNCQTRLYFVALNNIIIFLYYCSSRRHLCNFFNIVILIAARANSSIITIVTVSIGWWRGSWWKREHSSIPTVGAATSRLWSIIWESDLWRPHQRWVVGLFADFHFVFCQEYQEKYLFHSSFHNQHIAIISLWLFISSLSSSPHRRQHVIAILRNTDIISWNRVVLLHGNLKFIEDPINWVTPMIK